jgi:hypothetical protein
MMLMKLTYIFDEMGLCENPSVEYSFHGKYVAVKIVTAAIDADNEQYVFGTYFRGTYSYVGEACKNTNMPVAVAAKNQALARLLKSGIDYFESIKFAEVQAIQSSKWGSNKKLQESYDKEITALREKLSEYLQLNIF